MSIKYDTHSAWINVFFNCQPSIGGALCTDSF